MPSADMTQLFHQFRRSPSCEHAFGIGRTPHCTGCLRETAQTSFRIRPPPGEDGRKRQIPAVEMSVLLRRSVGRLLAVAEWKITCYARCCVPFQTKFKETDGRASEATFPNLVAAGPPFLPPFLPSFPPTLGLQPEFCRFCRWTLGIS